MDVFTSLRVLVVFEDTPTNHSGNQLAGNPPCQYELHLQMLDFPASYSMLDYRITAG